MTKRLICVFSVSMFLLGCANMNSIYREFDIDNGKSSLSDIRQRAILVGPLTVSESTANNVKTVTRTRVVCAEPSPDAMASLAYELAVKGGTAGKASGEIAVAMQDSAAFTGIRTQSIQLLRDFGYRLCESRMSGAITSDQYDLLMRRFQKNTVALLAIEQLTGAIKAPTVALISSGKAEATKSLAEQRVARENVGDRIAALEKQKVDLNAQIAAVPATLTAEEINEKKAESSALEGKITRSKDDLKLIDKAIVDAKGVLAEGKIEVKIQADAAAVQRSDEHLQKVTEAVKEIVNNIVLSDDAQQVCMSVLQGPALTVDHQIKLATWCANMLNNKAESDRLSTLASNIKLLLAQQVLADPQSTAKQKDAARKVAEDVQKEETKKGSGAGGGSRTYSVDQ